MKRKGFAEKAQHIYNPLPIVSPDDLMKHIHAKHPHMLDAKEAPKLDPFQVWIKYGGPPPESMILYPRQHLTVRENEVRQVLSRDITEQGVVVLDDLEDPKELREKSMHGLRLARQYWTARGERRVQELRKTLGLGREEIQDYAYDHFPYYYNQARADAVEAALNALSRGGKRKPNVSASNQKDVGAAEGRDSLAPA